MGFRLSKFMAGAAGGAGQALQVEHQNDLAMEKMEKWEKTKAEILDAREAKLAEIGAQNGKIGTYNPRDYTTDSWAEFVKTKDPSTLKRYAEFDSVMVGDVPYSRNPVTGVFEPAQISTNDGTDEITPDDVAENKGTVSRGGKAGELNASLEIQPKIEEAITKARKEAEAAVSKKISEMGQLNKLEDADAIYENLSGANLENIYGYGEKWYPDFLRSQEGIDLIAQRDQLVSMLTIAARGELKGQGPITDQEAGTLEKAATGLSNPNISPTLARRYLDSAMTTLYRNAGQRFEPGDTGQATPTSNNSSPPAAGARLAPDGNWYVERNGQFLRVDQ